MPKSWYAVHTIAGHENKVRDVLTRRAQVEGVWGLDIYEILIPTEREMQTRNGKRYEMDRKVFPGYILIQMALNDESFKLVSPRAASRDSSRAATSPCHSKNTKSVES